ncbi:HIT family protein [Psychroserpens burtonensis]|uniref:HIT family protein n=1 Tax=Psychroserpens burtonensis TaxID=49278 RepID=UPI001FDFA5FE|nr:HIT domain-containing protein [Psychroserpens burtonensis]
MDKAKLLIEENFNPNGYNIGMDCGGVAEQSVLHFHCHVMPRYRGNTENSKEGVRHCVKGKGNY